MESVLVQIGSRGLVVVVQPTCRRSPPQHHDRFEVARCFPDPDPDPEAAGLKFLSLCGLGVVVWFGRVGVDGS